jgi:hypothetical protein
MKRFLLLLSGGLLLTSSAFAQAGLRVGGGLMRHSAPTHSLGAGDVQHKARVGYEVGVYYQIPLSQRFSIVPEVQFSREQLRITETSSPSLADFNYTSDCRVNLSYLNVPVLLRAALGPVYLEAGPQVSLLIGGRGTGESVYYSWTASTVRRDINQTVTDRYQRFDAGFCLGVGAKLPAGLGLNLRAYQGLKQLNTGYIYTPGIAPIPYSGNKEYRQTLQLALTYQLAAR